MIRYIVRWLIRHDLVFVVAGPPGPRGPSGDRGAQGRMGKDGPVTAQFIPTCCVHCAPTWTPPNVDWTKEIKDMPLIIPQSALDALSARALELGRGIVKPPVIDTANGYYEGDVWIWGAPPGPGMGLDGEP